MEWLGKILHGMHGYQFYYPMFMSYLWMIGALYYAMRWERGRDNRIENVPVLPEYPPVSIVVPCHNEGEIVRETITYLLDLKYPDYEIIAVNDGSTDTTGAVLDELAALHPKLRVAHLAQNQGKAEALRIGTLLSPHDYLICIDGDALLDPHAVHWMMRHFLKSPRVGAITGNPRVRTRSTLLGKIQVGEFSSIIGSIKRAQRVYGRLFTVSGVVSAFRKTALSQVGYWDTDMVTEDIDISWKLQLGHWDIRYEPNALCWILMPETLKGLWKQRLRWSQGGAEVMFKYLGAMTPWRKRRMWPVYLEFFASVCWAYGMLLIFFLWALGKFVDLPPEMHIETLLPSWHGVVLGLTCMMQFAVSLIIDSRYERGIGRYYYWMIWYPMAFWFLTVFTTVVAVPKAFFKQRGTRARWKSPDRGLRYENTDL